MSIAQNIVFKLPHDPLTPIDPIAQPTPTAIARLQSELYANCRSIETSLGGGHHGHLGLVMPVALYLAMPNVGAGNEYDFPDRPDLPDFTGMNGNQRDDTKTQYQDELRIYNEAQSLHLQIKNLMLAAIPEVFIARLKHRLHNYANVSARDILAHVVDRYGTILPEHLDENLKQMDRLWDPTTNIQMVFNNADECRAFADAGGDPISDAMYIRRVLEVLKKSGVFATAIHNWNMKPAADKTIANLETHFILADKDRRQNEPTAKNALSANAATTNTLVTDTKDGDGIPKYYCWTHGLSTNPGHTSATCTKMATGHVKDATLQDMKGGNNTIRRRAGERAVFVAPKRPAATPKAATTEKSE
jgi:hypothetical protein